MKSPDMEFSGEMFQLPRASKQNVIVNGKPLEDYKMNERSSGNTPRSDPKNRV